MDPSQSFSAARPSRAIAADDALPGAIREPLLRELYGYWDRKRAAQAMPARGDLDPLDIPHLLPHVMLVDTAKTVGGFRYRLFGTKVAEGFLFDRTGVYFADLPRIENYDQVYEGYWRTYKERAPQYFHGRIVSSTREYLRYSRLTMPLSADGSEVDMLLGGVIFFASEKIEG